MHLNLISFIVLFFILILIGCSEIAIQGYDMNQTAFINDLSGWASKANRNISDVQKSFDRDFVKPDNTLPWYLQKLKWSLGSYWLTFSELYIIMFNLFSMVSISRH